MPTPRDLPVHPPASAMRIGRRSLLFGTGLAALAGCGDPAGSSHGTPGVIQQTPDASHAPSEQAPPASWANVAHQLQQTASLFAGAASAKGSTPAITAWAKGSASMCTSQAALLLTGDPLGSTQKVVAAPAHPAAQASAASALTAIGIRQNQQAASLTALARSASAGDEALLLVSLAAAAHATASPHAAPTATSRTPGHLDVGTRPDALMVLLGHIEAAIEGYETGAGSLPQTSPEVSAAQKRIQTLWQMRDDVQQQVDATPTPPPLGHRMPGGFGSVPTDHHTWALLETNILDAWARVAAASAGDDRSAAIGRVLAQVDAVQGLGAPISTWPGWS